MPAMAKSSSTPQPGVQKPHAGKSRAAPLGMTKFASGRKFADAENLVTLGRGLGCAYQGFDHGTQDDQAVFGV
jgi:hypothetical protein